MPKVTGKTLPLSGLLGIHKPSGAITMKLLNSVNELLASSELFLDQEKQGHHRARKYKRRGRAGKVKLGQGGTLDPLASGVLVLGINDGTKKLGAFLHGTKEYTVVGLLGSSTDSYDSEGKRVRSAPFAHVTKEKIESVLDRFRGEIKQLPPIYSALKMDGKPLYEYARQNIPLPKPIEARNCTIYNLELTGFKSGEEHNWTGAKTELSQEEKDTMNKLESLVKNEAVRASDADAEDATSETVPQASTSTSTTEEQGNTQDQHKENAERPPVFELKMTVSSGTYVRSIVHDIALAVDSAAHVVELVRTRQGPFALDPSAASTVDGEDTKEPLHGVIPWSVIEEGIQELRNREKTDEMPTDKDAMLPWEELIVKALIS